MKKSKHILLLSLISLSFFTYSQETQECVNEVSTNPNNEPSARHLNSLP